MKIKHFIFGLLLGSISFGFYAKPNPGKESFAIVGVNVIPMNKEQVLKDQTVIIENGKIKQIGERSKIKIETGTKTIDATGKYLLPGFYDMHAHFFYEQGENVNTCESELKIMLANGLTTARIECGDSVYLEARKKLLMMFGSGPNYLSQVHNSLVTGLGPEKFLERFVKHRSKQRLQ